MSEIVPLALRHCDAVAILHLLYLKTSFRGIPGQRLLRAYYRTVAQGVGACGYVAQDKEAIIGYVCGVWEPAMLRSVLFREHWLELIAWGSAQLAIQPALITSFISRMNEPLNESQAAAQTGYELRPIVVPPEARGTGIAADLVTTLLADARRRGFESLYLYTEANNAAANRFYRKVGFVQLGSIDRSGLAHVRYEKSAL